MQQDRIKAESSSLEYYYSLNGDTPLVCFHGYGENADSFTFLEKALPAGYSLFAINLPFHGNTEWNEKSNFSPAILTEITSLILRKHFYTHYPSGKKMILAGYSLGGRIALSIYEQIPEKVQKLVLLAPDGLKMNFWYWLATPTRFGNWLFKQTMENPSWFFGLINTGRKLGLVNNSIFRFVQFYIKDAGIRRLLYQRWTVLRNCRPDIKNIKRLIQEKQTQVRLIYGRHDRIIQTSIGERFIKGIETHSQLVIIHAGHHVLHEKHVKEILPALLQ